MIGTSILLGRHTQLDTLLAYHKRILEQVTRSSETKIDLVSGSRGNLKHPCCGSSLLEPNVVRISSMELPTSFYYLVGAIIVTNLGAIGSIIVVGFKGIWWMAQTDLQIKQNSKDINQAHEKIRGLSEKRSVLNLSD